MARANIISEGLQHMRSAIAIFIFTLAASPVFAADVDLTTANSFGMHGVGYFETTDRRPTGTGVIDPFVRVQNNGNEDGFNTDATVGSGDLADVKGGTWTHSLIVGSLSPVMRDGVSSYQFLLDINEVASKPLLSLDELRIYTASSGNISTLAVLNAQNLVYDMGAGNRVLLNYTLGTGSGSGDMYFYLPVSLFTGLQSQYLYLYSSFGASGGVYASDDGFEEWAHRLVTTPVESTTWGGIKRLQ